MTIAIPEFVIFLTPPLLAILAFVILAPYTMMKIERDADRDLSRDLEKALREARERVPALASDKTRLSRENSILVQGQVDTERRIRRAVRILEDGEEEDVKGGEEGESDDDEDAPRRRYYAFSLNTRNEHHAVLIRAVSAAEALGKAHLIAERECKDEVTSFAWTSEVDEPKT